MKISSLKLFCDVVDAGGFSPVARSLNVDPSKISRAISGLEDELGFPLFDRSTRRFNVTEAGQIYYQQILPLLDGLDSAEAEARDALTAPQGSLNVSASIAFGHAVIVPLLKEFNERYPGVALNLMLNDAQTDLARDGIDVAIRLGPAPEGDFVRTRLMDTQHLVCASPSYLKRFGQLDSPEALKDRDCVRFALAGYDSLWKFRDKNKKILNIPVSGSLTISNALALKRSVVDGYGPGLLGDWMIAEELANGELVVLFEDFKVSATDTDAAAWILYQQSAYLPMKIRVFIDFLKEKLSNA